MCCGHHVIIMAYKFTERFYYFIGILLQQLAQELYPVLSPTVACSQFSGSAKCMYVSAAVCASILQVFSWGSNSSGQLGHIESPSTVPRLAKVRTPPSIQPCSRTYRSLRCMFLTLALLQLSEGIRVWDMGAGERHTLLLADGDCIQPIIYYSGQQVKDGEEEATELVQQEEREEEEERGVGYTPQPVLLPFCMHVRTK